MLPELLPGDVLLTRSRGTIPALIRFGERIRFQGWPNTLGHLARSLTGTAGPDAPSDPWYVNHAALVVGDGNLIEALAQGLTLSPVSKYSNAELVIVRLADLLDGGEPDRAVLYAREQLARHGRYGWMSIASIVLQLVTPLRLDISWDGALICSAFAAQALEHAGVVLPTRSSLTTTPADLRAMPVTRPERKAA